MAVKKKTANTTPKKKKRKLGAKQQKQVSLLAVENQLAEAFRAKVPLKKKQAFAKAAELLEGVDERGDAYRMALAAGQGRYDEAVALVKSTREGSYLEDAIGLTLAVATMEKQGKLLDACLKRITAQPELLANPITVANVIGSLIGKSMNDEAAAISREHVKRMDDRGMTPVLYTNAMFAFAAADDTGKEAATLVRSMTELIDKRDGKYFRDNGSTKHDIRGSAFAGLALWYARKGDIKKVVTNLRESARVKYADLSLMALNPAMKSVRSHPDVKAIFNMETQSAIEEKNRAIAKNPRDWWAIFSRGLIYHEQNDLDLAEADYQQTIRLSPTYPDVYNNMANLFLARDENNRAEAIRWYTKALDRSKDHFTARRNRADAYWQMGSAKEALADAKHAIKVEPKAAFPYFVAALASSKLGDRAAAKTMAKTGLTLDETMDDIESEDEKKTLRELAER